jgi:hypothetical protein
VKSSYRLAGLLALVACQHGAGLKSDMIAARPMRGSGVSFGDCGEARKRAAVKPDLDVDRLPAPVKTRPAAFQKMPYDVKTHVDKMGATVKVDVVVDTLGRADMKTFKVVETSHSWLVENVKTVLPSWKFSPAELAGCKVRRVYKFSATAKPRA